MAEWAAEWERSPPHRLVVVVVVIIIVGHHHKKHHHHRAHTSLQYKLVAPCVSALIDLDHFHISKLYTNCSLFMHTDDAHQPAHALRDSML